MCTVKLLLIVVDVCRMRRTDYRSRSERYRSWAVASDTRPQGGCVLHHYWERPNDEFLSLWKDMWTSFCFERKTNNNFLPMFDAEDFYTSRYFPFFCCCRESAPAALGYFQLCNNLNEKHFSVVFKRQSRADLGQSSSSRPPVVDEPKIQVSSSPHWLKGGGGLTKEDRIWYIRNNLNLNLWGVGWTPPSSPTFLYCMRRWANSSFCCITSATFCCQSSSC